MKNKIYIALICAFSILLAVSSGFLYRLRKAGRDVRQLD